MGVKDCGHHGEDKLCKKKTKWILIGVGAFVLLVLLIIFIIWAVLRPTKPGFVVQDATVYSFNLTSPNTLTSTFQVTIQSRNPNDHIGIYYDRLVVYATYQDQQITLPTSIPQTYQDTESINIWSPFIYGNSVPIAPFIGASLQQAQASGNVFLLVKLNGQVRWRVGSFISGSYGIRIVCPTIIPCGNPNAGIPVGNRAVKYQLASGCSVSVSVS